MRLGNLMTFSDLAPRSPGENGRDLPTV